MHITIALLESFLRLKQSLFSKLEFQNLIGPNNLRIVNYSTKGRVKKKKSLVMNHSVSPGRCPKVIMPPSTKWKYIALLMSVGRSVGRPNLVRMITRHRIDLGLSNMVQTCVSECK